MVEKMAAKREVMQMVDRWDMTVDDLLVAKWDNGLVG